MKNHKEKSATLSELLNKNKIKISYCFIENIKKFFDKKFSTQNAKCSCRDTNRCPFNGKCTIDNIIYKAIVPKDVNNDNY